MEKRDAEAMLDVVVMSLVPWAAGIGIARADGWGLGAAFWWPFWVLVDLIKFAS